MNIFGLHAVEALLTNHPERIIRLCVFHQRNDKKLEVLMSLAKQSDIAVDHVSRTELDRMSQDGNHQGVVALCHKPKTYS
jgi:23S rRNA (guanosine2251-2'-O)-methyltransferase